MVHRLHLRVSLIPDVIVNGLAHRFIVLESNVRVAENLGTNAARLGANWCPITRAAKGQGVLSNSARIGYVRLKGVSLKINVVNPGQNQKRVTRCEFLKIHFYQIRPLASLGLTLT